MVKRISAAVIILLSAAGLIYSYDNPEYDPVIYKGRFFVLLEPAGPLEPEAYDEELALKRLLEEAQFIFSAMIYGFSFEYVPKDNSRGIEEGFVLEPVYSIPWGDSGMKISGGRYKDGRYDAEISYRVSDVQLPWVTSWDTNILPDISAVGEGNLYSGSGGKKDAIGDSIRQAVRNYLRPRTYDKPRRVTGSARLAEVPYFSMDSGRYLCKSKVTLRIAEVLEYELY